MQNLAIISKNFTSLGLCYELLTSTVLKNKIKITCYFQKNELQPWCLLNYNYMSDLTKKIISLSSGILINDITKYGYYRNNKNDILTTMFLQLSFIGKLRMYYLIGYLSFNKMYVYKTDVYLKEYFKNMSLSDQDVIRNIVSAFGAPYDICSVNYFLLILNQCTLTSKFFNFYSQESMNLYLDTFFKILVYKYPNNINIIYEETPDSILYTQDTTNIFVNDKKYNKLFLTSTPLEYTKTNKTLEFDELLDQTLIPVKTVEFIFDSNSNKLKELFEDLSTNRDLLYTKYGLIMQKSAPTNQYYVYITNKSIEYPTENEYICNIFIEIINLSDDIDFISEIGSLNCESIKSMFSKINFFDTYTYYYETQNRNYSIPGNKYYIIGGFNGKCKFKLPSIEMQIDSANQFLSDLYSIYPQETRVKNNLTNFFISTQIKIFLLLLLIAFVLFLLLSKPPQFEVV